MGLASFGRRCPYSVSFNVPSGANHLEGLCGVVESRFAATGIGIVQIFLASHGNHPRVSYARAGMRPPGVVGQANRALGKKAIY